MQLQKTVCGAHRVEGYHLVGGVWVCKRCGLAEHRHETIAETLARKERERTAGH